jgi:hypothetical protein
MRQCRLAQQHPTLRDARNVCQESARDRCNWPRNAAQTHAAATTSGDASAEQTHTHVRCWPQRQVMQLPIGRAEPHGAWPRRHTRTWTVVWPQLKSEIESLCELARQQRTAKSAPEEMPETEVPPVAPSLGRGGSATGAVASLVSATGDSKMCPSVVVSRPVPPLANTADNTANTHTAFIAALVSKACAFVRGSRTLDVTPAMQALHSSIFTVLSSQWVFDLRKFTTFESLLSPRSPRWQQCQDAVVPALERPSEWWW